MGLCLVGGTVLAFIFGFWYAFPVLLIGVFLTIGYFLLGTVQSAAQLVQTQDLEAAENRLALTFFPNLLFSMFKSNYYMIKGSIAMQKKDTKQAEHYLKLADKSGVSSDNEKAVILLQQAGIAFQRQNFTHAKKLLREVKELKVTEDMLKSHIKEFEKALAQSGKLKAAQRQGAYGMKRGKRQPKRR